MTSIQGRGRFRRERISKSSLGFLPLLESSHNKAPVNPPAFGLFKPLVAKYTEEDLQKIFRTILKAQASPSDRPYEKALKISSPDVYCDKSHIEYYNFC